MIMIKRHVTTIAFFLLLVGCFPYRLAAAVGTDAGQAGLSAAEQLLVGKINRARTDLAVVIRELGLSPQTILSNHPDLKPVLTAGLTPLTVNGLLTEAAVDHTRDMLARDYYDQVDPEGVAPAARIHALGYGGPVVAEKLGVVGFRNFIDPTTAIGILFKNTLLDELNDDDPSRRVILNPSYTEIGVGVRTGVLHLSDTPANVYLTTCDFGSGPASAVMTIEMAESSLVHLINQVRRNPTAVFASAGIDVDFFLKKQPQWADMVLGGHLNALAPNDRLFAAARNHTQEMAALRFFDHHSNDGQTTEERLITQGYQPLVFAEHLDLVAMPETETLEAVVALFFERLLDAAVWDNAETAGLIFDPVATQIGVGLRALKPEAGEFFRHLYMLTIDVAVPADSLDMHLLGVVFADRNTNGLFDPGEGIAGMPLTIDYPHQMLDVVTDDTGGLNRVLGPGDTRIIVWPGVLDDEFWVILDDGGSNWFAHSVSTVAY